MKTFGDAQGVSVNGLTSAATTGTTNFTAYISPYLVVNNGGYYSKHIYIGSQRITSKLGSSDIFDGSNRNPLTDATANNQNYASKLSDLTTKIKTRYDSLGVVYRGTSQGSAGLITSAAGRIATPLKYFYHSDHLGSSSLITDANGDVTQHIEYVPFGEVFVEERNNSWSTPYKFNAKELDEETGLYYYGARYYNPRSSVWLSPDELREKYPNVGSYVYCDDNPVKYVDPDGREKIISFDLNDKIHDNRVIIRAALKVKDDNSIHIWGHGNNEGFEVNNGGKKYMIKNARQLNNFLMRYSRLWKQRDSNQKTTVVLHSCETGQGDSNNPSFAQNLSADGSMKNVTIIAPTESVVVDGTTEKGTYKTDDKVTTIVGEGRWLEFENGKINSVHPADWTPKEPTRNKVLNRINRIASGDSK